MARHALVTWTLETLASNYQPGNVATTEPALVDDGDGTVHEIDSGTLNALQRQYQPDPSQTNIVTVDPDPGRQDEPIGTGYDLRVTDAVGILVEGVHADNGGELSNPDAFGDLYEGVRRALLVERDQFPTIDGQLYHTLVPRNAGRPPADQNSSTYFAYEFDLEFRAYEDLP